MRHTGCPFISGDDYTTIRSFLLYIFKERTSHSTSVMSRDLRFKHPFTCIISVPSGSGKSSFCIRFLEHLDTLRTETVFDGGILWCYGETNAIPSVNFKVQFHEGVPENITNKKKCL
jgi:hypothetical protein